MKEKSSTSIHFGEYQVIKLSPDGKLIASGDNQRTISVYEADSKKVVCDTFDSILVLFLILIGLEIVNFWLLQVLMEMLCFGKLKSKKD